MLIAFINFSSLSCHHVGWHRSKQPQNCAGCAGLEEATGAPWVGDVPPQWFLQQISTRAVLAQRTKKGTPENSAFCWFLSHYRHPADINKECRNSSWRLSPPIPLLLVARTLKSPKKYFTMPKALLAHPAPVSPGNATAQALYKGFTA